MEKKQNRSRNLWLRIVIPAVLIIIWFVVGGLGGPTFGKLNNVTTNNQADFLPASADSTKVQNIETKFLPSSTIPTIVVLSSNKALSPTNLKLYVAIGTNISKIPGVSLSKGSVVGPILSKDSYALEYIVQISNYKAIDSVITTMRSELNKSVPSGITVYVTGPGGIGADLIHAFNGIDGILLYVAIAAVFIILVLVYRSIILPFLVLMTAMFALMGAILLVYALASHNVIKLNGQSQGILSILAIGASTDYSLLIIARYREALEHVESKGSAIMHAMRASIEPISATAATVILALLCLLFSDLNSNRSLGPIAALGIVFSFLSAMSFLPSILFVLGRRAFWPFKPKVHPEEKLEEYAKMKTGLEDRKGIWKKVAEFVARRYRVAWIIIVVLLLISALGLAKLKASGTSQASSILGKSNAVAGEKVLADHFVAGSGSPMIIVVNSSQLASAMEVLGANRNISSSLIYSNNLPSKTNPKPSPLVVNHQVLIESTLVPASDSSLAQQTVTQLRSSFNKTAPSALVGGTTAIQLDTNTTSKADLKKIIPIVLLVILLILIILLRALIAPIILVLSVILSFSASLGISALVFNSLFHFPGSDPSIVLFGFIFLVALGVDYNIFLMSRVREETLKLGTHAGILRGLSVTGGVITSAGIVLAATFAALAVIPILFLVQIAFIVAFGVLVDTILVRSLLVPSVSYDIGRKIWWPSKLAKKAK